MSSPNLNVDLIQDVIVEILQDYEAGTKNPNNFSKISTLILSGKEPLNAFLDLFKYGTAIINHDFIEINNDKSAVSFYKIPIGFWKFFVNRHQKLMINTGDVPENLLEEIVNRGYFNEICSQYSLNRLQWECILHQGIGKLSCTSTSIFNILQLDGIAYSNIESLEIIADDLGSLKACFMNFKIPNKMLKISSILDWDNFWSIFVEISDGPTIISRKIKSLEIEIELEIDFPEIDGYLPLVLDKIGKLFPNLQTLKFNYDVYDTVQTNPIWNNIPTFHYLNGIVSSISNQIQHRQMPFDFEYENQFAEFVDFSKPDTIQIIEAALNDAGFKKIDQTFEMGMQVYQKWECCKADGENKKWKIVCNLYPLDQSFIILHGRYVHF